MTNPLRNEFFFISTGDAAKDEEIAAQYRLRSARMDENVCPNGCQKMEWIDAHNRECKKCGSAGFSTKPFDMNGGTA